MIRRRTVVAAASAVPFAGCATGPAAAQFPPIVFVPGNGDSASIWQTTVWRFESNGWPRERLHTIELPAANARDDDTVPQPGRSSTAEHMAFIRGETERVLKLHGASQVVLVGVSRGGLGIRDYVQNGGGERTVSHAILCGTPNHGLWSAPIAGLPDGSEFSGRSAYITSLNKPKNAAGDEVTGPVRWLTIRSDRNDKYAQPDGLWLGKRGVTTGVSYDAPELKGALNVVLPRADHRETATSAAAFDAMFRFITGRAPARTDLAPEDRVLLAGKVSHANMNTAIDGAQVEVFVTDHVTGERKGASVYRRAVGADGRWGPMQADREARYEFVVSAPGYAVTHFYRSPFPRSSDVVQMRPERIPDADKNAPSLVLMYRPRGYLDPLRDRMAFDGQSPPPGAINGAGVATSRIKPAGLPRTVVAEFNGEKVVGRSWPLADQHIAVLELTG